MPPASPDNSHGILLQLINYQEVPLPTTFSAASVAYRHPLSTSPSSTPTLMAQLKLLVPLYRPSPLPLTTSLLYSTLPLSTRYLLCPPRRPSLPPLLLHRRPPHLRG